jgi:hypothetical protein
MAVIEIAAGDVQATSDVLRDWPNIPNHNEQLNRGRQAWQWFHDDTNPEGRTGRLRFRDLAALVDWDVVWFRERLVKLIDSFAVMRLKQPVYVPSEAEQLRRTRAANEMTNRAKALKESKTHGRDQDGSMDSDSKRAGVQPDGTGPG